MRLTPAASFRMCVRRSPESTPPRSSRLRRGGRWCSSRLNTVCCELHRDGLDRMASGFIVLKDGRCLAVGYPLHDAVLISVLEALPDGDPLRAWLETQVPGTDD